ncbi:MAG TPA: hypothetical protein ENK18_23910 [Deltaproteobacteria bacterium]|nr:hypothetical protein [Deltaproteobacteria bacterium]
MNYAELVSAWRGSEARVSQHQSTAAGLATRIRQVLAEELGLADRDILRLLRFTHASQRDAGVRADLVPQRVLELAEGGAVRIGLIVVLEESERARENQGIVLVLSFCRPEPGGHWTVAIDDGEPVTLTTVAEGLPLEGGLHEELRGVSAEITATIKERLDASLSWWLAGSRATPEPQGFL